jgi:hypothetical protein
MLFCAFGSPYPFLPTASFKEKRVRYEGCGGLGFESQHITGIVVIGPAAIVALDAELGFQCGAARDLIRFSKQHDVARGSVLPIMEQVVLAHYDPEIFLCHLRHHSLQRFASFGRGVYAQCPLVNLTREVS